MWITHSKNQVAKCCQFCFESHTTVLVFLTSALFKMPLYPLKPVHRGDSCRDEERLSLMLCPGLHLRDGEGHGSPACCSPRGLKESNIVTEQ